MIRVYIKNNRVLRVEDADVQIFEIDGSVTDTVGVLNGSPYIITEPKEIEAYEAEQNKLLLERISASTTDTKATTTNEVIASVVPVDTKVKRSNQ